MGTIKGDFETLTLRRFRIWFSIVGVFAACIVFLDRVILFGRSVILLGGIGTALGVAASA
jgi:hypothetical protein